ncbi:MAG: alpha/beta fold hydrolase [Cellvibrionales bacterium]|nr:alpha/beta fold hydrolase [Cellvibrionales bacterium]
MPIIHTTLKSQMFCTNPHYQTIWPTLRYVAPKDERKAFFIGTPDGDEIYLDIQHPDQAPSKGILLLHGLTGSSDSRYIIQLQQILKQHNILSVAMNYRGAKKPNCLATTYHAGKTDDLELTINTLVTIYPTIAWQAAGFSLGGNILLKYLGENPSNPLTKAIAVSTPFKLDQTSTKMDQGISKIYRNRLLNAFKLYLSNKLSHLKKTNRAEYQKLQALPISKNYQSFWDLDNDVIAPLHGFDSAIDYYTKSSCISNIKNIRTPTHILQAKDDPFMPKSVIPLPHEISEKTTLEITDHGGHLGFHLSQKPAYFIDVIIKGTSKNCFRAL